ncbi:hypothetical protein HWQ18_10795 [Enterobacter ludwigii]|uniref:hypothetical protein n=1 Tax=Enterobacter ludwigii TaxID=299767 RepID=UPI00159C4909|nr:hypothetical protein [Enterobacter ludwigii]QLA04977.1 hypothetical protein HWQ18_10795 [Enterobacter ludwigii]
MLVFLVIPTHKACDPSTGIINILKAIYQASKEEAGPQALEAFASAWDNSYPQVRRS